MYEHFYFCPGKKMEKSSPSKAKSSIYGKVYSESTDDEGKPEKLTKKKATKTAKTSERAKKRPISKAAKFLKRNAKLLISAAHITTNDSDSSGPKTGK